MSTEIIIIDRDWDQVTVQVRKGNNGDPEQNPSMGEQTLQRGGEPWRFLSEGESVWYRREADPIHHTGQWGNWTDQPVFPNDDPITITLG
jgi:hypothetical protein